MNEELKVKINKLFYGLMKEAGRSSLSEFLENWDLTGEDLDAITAYFLTQGLELKAR